MDDLPFKHSGPFGQKITLSCQTLDFFLRLLLLLESVKNNQSLMLHCPIRTEAAGFPNVTSEAGSSFFFKQPTLAALGHMRHYQLSLADGDSALPHWMEFRREGGSLAGLALTEDCGIYHLKVSVFGEQHAEYFYLHILNQTVTDKNSARNTLSCSEGEMTTWASLLLQLNAVALDASQRVRLVSTMADYLHLPLGSVYLFSRRTSFIQQQEKLRVCRQGGLAEKVTGGNEKQDVAQLLWCVGCHGEKQQSDLAKVLEHGATVGGLARLLEAPVVGWRVLCASRAVRRKVKRDSHRLKFTPTPDIIVPLPAGIHPDPTEEISVKKKKLPQPCGTHAVRVKFTSIANDFAALRYHASLFSIKQTTSYPYSKDVSSLPEQKVFTGKVISTTSYTSVSAEFGKQVSEVISDTSLSISDFHLPFLPEQTSTVMTFPGDSSADTAPSLSPSTPLHGIYPSLQLTPASCRVTSTLTHEAVDRKSLAIRLTLRPRSEETPLWSGAYRGSHTDSESPPTVSSLGHISYNQGAVTDHHTATPTLHNLPSVSHPPPKDNYDDVLLLNSRLKTIQSPPPSNRTPSTQHFPDVSPTSYFMTEQLPITQHSDTIQHLSSVLNQDVMAQLNVTTQDVSSTTLAGQLTLSGQTELESSLSVAMLEPSVTTFTPALPSELGFLSGQFETPSTIHSVFTVESLEASLSPLSPLQTFVKSPLPYADVSSLQKNLEGPVLCFDQNTATLTLKSDILLTSLQPAYPFSALQMSLPLIRTHHIISVPLSMLKDQPFEEQPPVKSSYESIQSMPSLQQTLPTLLLVESPQIDRFSYTSSVTGMTTSMYLLTTFAPLSSAIYPTPLSIIESIGLVSGDHFDPTAPSAVQNSYTTSFTLQVHSLDPSLPLCGQSVAEGHGHANGCTLKIKSTYLESTVEHVLDVLTSDSQDEKHGTVFQTQFLMFDSSGQLFSTQTSNPTMHLSATTEIDHLTATPQMDISLEDSSFSVITYTSALSIENSLLIRQTDSSGLIAKGRPTQQILSTSLSPFHEMSTTLLTLSQAVGLSSYRRQSSVQPTPSSASITSSTNLPPKVLQSIPVLMATVGFPFHYSIPPETFLDPEDGEADALSLEIRLIDGPPIGLGTWLSLDGLELHGVPLEVDLLFAPKHLLLAARDRQGLSTWLPLTLDLHRSPVDPCHVFTLTAKLSLHSILRHRRKVELLLRKLSRFFNSSSSRHLSVVSMRPGSTVVSWYNHSLCRMGNNRVRRCNVDRIRSMWLEMRSEDGSVNPVFRESMLPEFAITKVGPVSYRQDCFPTTSTPSVHTTLAPNLGTNASLHPISNTFISASPATTSTSQQLNRYKWMAGVLTALLVVCLLILILLLVATVLHFCKGRARSRTVTIWPSGRMISVQSSRDLLRAIRPRRPPLFRPELPPPPLRLWISLSQGDEEPSPWEQGRKILDQALQPRQPHYDFSDI